MLFFGRRHHQPQGMSFKTKILLILFLVALFYIFKGPIMAHFGFEEVEHKQATTETQAPRALPATLMVKQNATVFQEPGQKPYATVGAGQPVSIIDMEDNGQSFINVRHNGMAGYIARRDLALGNK